MDPITVVVLAVLLLVVFLAVKWAQFVFGLLGLLLVIAGGWLVLNLETAQKFVEGGNTLRSLSPQLQTISFVTIGLGALLLIGSFFLKKLVSLRIGFMVFGILVMGLLGFAEVKYGHFVRLALKHGLISVGQLEHDAKYQGTSKDNLKALYLALIAEHDSEGAFPKADEWMDAIKDRIATNNMSQAEAMKKYVNPLIQPPKEGQFGYAMNDAAGGKYIDDVKDKDNTLLIFDSSDTSKNAHGNPNELLPDPERSGGNLGITVSGRLVKVREDGKLEPVEEEKDK